VLDLSRAFGGGRFWTDELVSQPLMMALAVRLGDRGGSLIDSTPALIIIFRNSATAGHGRVNQVPFSNQDSIF
jgi:hypothetical protein